MVKSQRKKNARLSLQLDSIQYNYIKLLAEREGITLTDFVCKALPYPGQNIVKDLNQKEFSNLMYELTHNLSQHLKNLSK